MKPKRTLVFVAMLLFVVLAFTTVGSASKGDKAPVYRKCVRKCQKMTCAKDPSLPLVLWLMRWTCEDNCRYNCMHDITKKAVSRGEDVLQYHGKWPFHRLLGMQEPASVLFSVLNGHVHYRALAVLRKRISNGYYMKPYYVAMAFLGVNSWVWSAIYHSRDSVFTERMDYFSAGLCVLYALYATVIRVFDVRRPLPWGAWTCLCAAAYAGHVGYLSLFKFDYGYNMTANVACGMLNNVIWTTWSLGNWWKRPEDAWKPIGAIFLLMSAMSFELFDFSPVWGILDAHALWHAITIPIAKFWYEFLIDDAVKENQREKKGKNVMR